MPWRDLHAGRGLLRPSTVVKAADKPEVIFNDMTVAELRNISDMPYACREWMKIMLDEKGIIAPDPV